MITEIVSFNCHPRIDRDEMIRGASGTFNVGPTLPALSARYSSAIETALLSRAYIAEKH